MILRRALPIGTDADPSIDLESPDARARISELYSPPGPNWVRLNLIETLDGRAVGADGTSETISNPVDRVILNVIRSFADVVVVGAASVRAEGYFVPRRAALAVVTRSGDLAGHRVTSGGERGAFIVLCPAASVDRAGVTVRDPDARIIAVPDVGGQLPAAAIIAALQDAGFASIVCEGGPTLAAHLLAGAVVDELCITTAPQLIGAGIPLLAATGVDPIALSLAQLLLDDNGATYARYSLVEERAQRASRDPTDE